MKIIITIIISLFAFNANADELDHLIYNSIEGGSQTDKVVDMVSYNDTLYVVMHTESSDLPANENSYQNTTSFLQDIYIVKYLVDYQSVTLLESTYFGTDEDDFVTDIKVDVSGNVVIAGYTNSPVFPIVGGLQNQNISGTYGFIIKFNSDLSDIIYSTQIGATGEDKIYSIFLSNTGAIYFGGQTTSTDLKTDFGSHQKSFVNGTDGFYGMLNKSGNVIDRLSYMGGNGDDYVKDIFVVNDFLYFIAATSSSDITTHPSNGFGSFKSQPYDQTHDGGFDFLIGKFKDASEVEFLTYYGGEKDEIPVGIWVINDKTYFAGSTASTTAEGLDLSDNAANSDLIGGESDFILGQLEPLASTGSGNWKRYFQELGFATTFGSRGTDIPESMIFDPNRFAFIITGKTNSKNYPSTYGEKGYGGTDGVVSIVSTSGAEVLDEFLIGGLGDENSVAIANINNSFFVASNTNRPSVIEKSWNGISDMSTDGDDYIISRFSPEQINISTPDTDPECISGNLNINFSRLNDVENLPVRVTLMSKMNPEFKLTFEDEKISDDFLSIPYDDYDFVGGEYTLTISLLNGVFDYVDPLTLVPSPKIISTEIDGLNENSSLCENSSLMFTATDNGYGTSYKWFYNNVAITGQTESTLIIDEVGPDNEGTYRYEVIGECTPNAKSDNFTVEVVENVKDISVIDDIKVTDGLPFSVTAEAQGEDLSYEWYKNGEKILGQSNQTLSYQKATESLEGSYKVKVFNECSEMESNSFTVTVEPNSVNLSNDNNSAIVYQENGFIYYTSKSINSSNPVLLDITGKILASPTKIDHNKYVFAPLNQSGVYFIIDQSDINNTTKFNYIND